MLYLVETWRQQGPYRVFLPTAPKQVNPAVAGAAHLSQNLAGSQVSF